jgi:type I restriction enzyme S subunit
LGSVAQVIAGQSPEGKFYNDNGNGLPFYQGKKEFGERHIGPPTTWTTEITKIAEPGDILMSVRAPVGPVNFTQERICIGRGLAAIRTGNEISPDFLFYQLLSKQDEIAGTEGAVFASINKAGIESVQIVAPASEEQRRIVTLLDEAFADIATAKANAEKNLQNARELASELSAQILSAPSANCTTQSLEDIVEADCSLSYGIVQPGDEFESGLPIVRPVDLDRPLIELDGLKRIDPTLAKGYERTKLKGGEVLLCVRGTTGTLSCAASALAGANVTRGIVPIRFNPNCVSQQLGYFLMRSAPVQAQIRAKTYGTALMQINIRDLRQIQIPVPHPSQQAAIAKALQDAEAQTSRLAEIQSQKLTALDDLNKSLLHQAFSGQL